MGIEGGDDVNAGRVMIAIATKTWPLIPHYVWKWWNPHWKGLFEK